MTKTIFTIGFIGSSAHDFFLHIKEAKVAKVIDVRLWASTQNAGFAKANDLKFFLSALCKIPYIQDKNLAPTAAILKAYKNKTISWLDYENQYLNLLKNSNITFNEFMDGACFLCAESSPKFCHRCLLAEYLSAQCTDLRIVHL